MGDMTRFTSLLVCCALVAASSCRRNSARKSEQVMSSVQVRLEPAAALSARHFAEDEAIIRKRLEALKLKNMTLKEGGRALQLTFMVPPRGNRGTHILRNVSWLISHTGRWSVHPIAPLPPADTLPREVTEGRFMSIRTLSSARRDILTKFLDSLGDPYPRQWVMMRETEAAGGVVWHAFLVAPQINARIRASRIVYSAPAPAALLLDDTPWTAGTDGTIKIPKPRLFGVLVKDRLHVPWKLQQVSSYTSFEGR